MTAPNSAQQLDRVARERLHDWVLDIFGTAAKLEPSGFSCAAGRISRAAQEGLKKLDPSRPSEFTERLHITPGYIKDFGWHDHENEKRKGLRRAVEIVMLC
jgi:hypothetical protein